MIMAAVDYYLWEGEVDPTMCANCMCLVSYDVAMSKVNVANATS